VQNKFELGGQHVPIVVKASVPSYGGLLAKRTAKLVQVAESISFPESLPIGSSAECNQSDIEVMSKPQHTSLSVG